MSSIKNEIVFWWRALEFRRYVEEAGERADLKVALSRMQRDERLLFGDADQGQGLFVAILDNKRGTPNKAKALLDINRNVGLAYMGYGLLDTEDKAERDARWQSGDRQKYQPKREYLDSASFTLRLRFKPCVLEDEAKRALVHSLCRAIQMMGMVGAFGGRKRRGFGSLSLRAFEGCPCCEDFVPVLNVAELQQRIRTLIGERQLSGQDWPLSAFARETDIRVWMTSAFKTGSDALEAAGQEFRSYRSWRSGQRNCKPDHDWFRSAWRDDGRHKRPAWKKRDTRTLPERAAFGLPHNYFKAGVKPLSAVVVPDASDGERRASPLIFRIAQVGNSFAPVAMFFDNLFLPSFARVAGQGVYEGTLNIAGSPSAEYHYNREVVLDFLNGAARSGSAGSLGSQGGSPFKLGAL